MTTFASGASEVVDQIEVNQLRLRWLTVDDWDDLRRMRLAALADSPRFFLARHEKEVRYSARRWRREFRRGRWVLAYLGDQPIGMMGVTWFKDIPEGDRYIEYLWIDPARRGKGMASAFVREIIEKLANDRVGTIWLWILDGNERASRLYANLGFESAGKPKALKKCPGRSETKMALRLSCPLPATGAQLLVRLRTPLAAAARVLRPRFSTGGIVS
jgi:RimJ/RimL family protein N-acetyltransferase